MTFKNKKFEDSEVMRSLERIAQQKKMFPEETVKIAKKQDLSPSGNLMQNIIKLCNGLRQEGLHNYAQEIESKYLAYKRAEGLYPVSSETGEDMIEAAHPEGSPKLEDVDSDEAVIETVLDQQLKDLKMVEKTPTGKTASLISSVKKIFAQDVSSSGEIKGKITSLMTRVSNIVRGVVAVAEAENVSLVGVHRAANKAYEAAASPTVDNLDNLKTALSHIRDFLNPGTWTNALTFSFQNSALTKENWARVSEQLNSCFGMVDQAKVLNDQYIQLTKTDFNSDKKDSVTTGPERQGTTSTTRSGSVIIYGTISKNLSQLNAFKSLITISNKLPGNAKQTALKWVDAQVEEFQKVKDAFDGLDEDSRNENSEKFMTALQPLVSETQTFYNTWIK